MFIYRRSSTYVVNEQQTGSSSVEESTAEITPRQAGDHGRSDERDREQEFDVPPVLPPNDGVVGQVANVGNTGLPPGLDDHPADMRPEKAVVSSVRVEVSVGISVMSAVASRPPFDGTLDGTSAGHGEEVFERLGGIVGAMGPETMVSCRNPKSGWGKEPKSGAGNVSLLLIRLLTRNCRDRIGKKASSDYMRGRDCQLRHRGGH